jgi:hypothetical protein
MRLAFAFAFLAATVCAALADSEPVIVIPSRPGVPIIVNGRDVSYAVLEGDWGLGKSVHIQPTAYPTNWKQIYKPAWGHYYPHTGRMPGYGRLEIETPPQQLAQPETYYRSWSAESQPTPPSPPSVAVPFDPPPIILAPGDRRSGPRNHTPFPHHPLGPGHGTP